MGRWRRLRWWCVRSAAGDQLVAYVVPAAGVCCGCGRCCGRVWRSGLPAYMVPSAVVVLDAFPLTSAGKLDRKALPEPVFEARVFRAPATPVEEIVAAVFAGVLGVERVGLDDDFFEFGGNSLIATQVVARLGRFGRPCRVRASVRGVRRWRRLAARVERSRSEVAGWRCSCEDVRTQMPLSLGAAADVVPQPVRHASVGAYNMPFARAI